VDNPLIESLGFGTTDLNGDGASFRMLIKGIVTVFQEKAEITIVAMEYDV
jgi:hypothetical protein